jgi:hypothetical protein
MRRRVLSALMSLPLPAMLLLAATVVSAQTPAINPTPQASGSAAPQTMASPSNEANIPKGSNPESASGNLSPGSGATLPSTASDTPTPSQTANNPESTTNDNAAGGNADAVPQGKYASPPTP